MRPLVHKVWLGLNCLTRIRFCKVCLLSSGLALAACQSTPPIKIVKNNPPVYGSTHLVPEPAYKPLAVQQARQTINKGLTDVMWDFVSVNGKNPLIFTNRPYLYLQSTSQGVSGSTGCNPLTGSYHLQATENISLDAKAAHMNCGDALLAQEADVMDALGRVATYRLQQNMLYLYDRQGQLLLTAKSR